MTKALAWKAQGPEFDFQKEEKNKENNPIQSILVDHGQHPL